jgi:hypothetical protein
VLFIVKCLKVNVSLELTLKFVFKKTFYNLPCKCFFYWSVCFRNINRLICLRNLIKVIMRKQLIYFNTVRKYLFMCTRVSTENNEQHQFMYVLPA